MDILQVIILTIIIIALIVFLAIYSIRKANFYGKDVLATATSAPIISESLELERVQENGITIPLELLPATTEIDERRLFEITDRTVIARISATIPTAAEVDFDSRVKEHMAEYKRSVLNITEDASFAV